jgi:membrane-bound inhibitor of C-type lysozyme
MLVEKRCLLDRNFLEHVKSNHQSYICQNRNQITIVLYKMQQTTLAMQLKQFKNNTSAIAI